MKISRDQRRLLLELSTIPGVLTPNWRTYVPLSNRGLVHIEELSVDTPLGSVYRKLTLTEKGSGVVSMIESADVALWRDTANRHARAVHTARTPLAKPCICWACRIAMRMAPAA